MLTQEHAVRGRLRVAKPLPCRRPAGPDLIWRLVLNRGAAGLLTMLGFGENNSNLVGGQGCWQGRARARCELLCGL